MDKIKIAIYDSILDEGKFLSVVHGFNVVGLNVVFAEQSHMHNIGKCEWCDGLRRIVKSRVGFFSNKFDLYDFCDDEREIIERLICRINQGRNQYGNWNINDGRDYKKEAMEEVLDGLLYTAALLIKEVDG